jgi:hypothetical protein
MGLVLHCGPLRSYPSNTFMLTYTQESRGPHAQYSKSFCLYLEKIDRRLSVDASNSSNVPSFALHATYLEQDMRMNRVDYATFVSQSE